MLTRIGVVALNTYRESVRARILLGLAGVAFSVSLFSIVIGAFTLNQGRRVVSDLGIATTSLFAVAVAVLVSATSLHRELEQKTLFPILARPITRAEYLVGKYLGTVLTVGVFVLAESGLVLFISSALAGRSAPLVVGIVFAFVAALGLVVWRRPKVATFAPVPWALLFFVVGALLAAPADEERRVVLASACLTMGEVAIVAGIATMFASFSTPFLSTLFTLGVWIVGRSADTLEHFPARFMGEAARKFAGYVARVWPNLQVYVPPRPLLMGEVPDVDVRTYVALAMVKAACWAILMLAVASYVFRKRDFL